MGVRLRPLENLSPLLKSVVKLLAEDKLIRVDRIALPWKYHIGRFKSAPGRVVPSSLSTTQHLLGSLVRRGLVEVVRSRKERKVQYYRLKAQYLDDVRALI